MAIADYLPNLNDLRIDTLLCYWVDNPLRDNGLTALSTGLRMLTCLDIGNQMSDSDDCKAGLKGRITLVGSLTQLTRLRMGRYIRWLYTTM
jgi:hypothetical protein